MEPRWHVVFGTSPSRHQTPRRLSFASRPLLPRGQPWRDRAPPVQRSRLITWICDIQPDLRHSMIYDTHTDLRHPPNNHVVRRPLCSMPHAVITSAMAHRTAYVVSYSAAAASTALKNESMPSPAIGRGRRLLYGYNVLVDILPGAAFAITSGDTSPSWIWR